MQSTLNEVPSKSIEFPCLMVSNTYGTIVLFSDKVNGLAVHNGSGPFSDAINKCLGVWDITCFRIFNGTITLSN